MLQEQAGVVLACKFGGKMGDHGAGIKQAQGAQNRFGGEIPVGPVDHVRTHDANRDRRGAQDRFGHRPDQQLANRTGRMRAHQPGRSLARGYTRQDLVCGQP
jgi:hypothetical protein